MAPASQADAEATAQPSLPQGALQREPVDAAPRTPTEGSRSVKSTRTADMTPVGSEFRAAAAEQGKGLSERLQGVTSKSGVAGGSLRLCQVRGFTGTTHEGVLLEESDPTFMCCFGPKVRRGLFVVKGPWMLKFKKDGDDAKASGLPIPLDGATVAAVGDLQFEVSNLHVKEDFFGKETLQRLHKDAKTSFKHSVRRRFTASSPEVRDEWVQKLQGHTEWLTERLARKMQNKSMGKPGQARMKSIATVAEVNSVAAALFAEFEEELEVDLFRQEVAMAPMLRAI